MTGPQVQGHARESRMTLAAKVVAWRDHASVVAGIREGG